MSYCNYDEISNNTTESYKCNIVNNYKNVIDELSNTKLKHIKVCKNCNEIGHNIKSNICKFNIEKNNKLTNKIKKYILSQNILSNTTLDEHLEFISNELNISLNMCKTLYKNIPPIELCNVNIDLRDYIGNIKNNIIYCNDCNVDIINIHQNTNRIWKEKILCDSCWGNYKEEREILWNKISQYKKLECIICGKIQTNKYMRFNYDHINMFDKGNSICTMVNEGEDIDNIYKELDKCQVLCLTCHHIVTDIENKLVFTRTKTLLTRKLNSNDITEQEYDNEKQKLSILYENAMINIYNKLKSIYCN